MVLILNLRDSSRNYYLPKAAAIAAYIAGDLGMHRADGAAIWNFCTL